MAGKCRVVPVPDGALGKLKESGALTEIPGCQAFMIVEWRLCLKDAQTGGISAVTVWQVGFSIHFAAEVEGTFQKLQ
jgi:hypothetical protein